MNEETTYSPINDTGVVKMYPLRFKAATKTYWMMCVFAVPMLALAIFLLKQPGQQKYALAFAGIVAFCFLNIATIRLFFDGTKVVYSSLLKRTRVQMDEVTGAKIGYPDTGGNMAVFFFLSTRKRGDIMLNLDIFSRPDAQEFCRRLSAMGIVPQVAHGLRARLLANALYPEGLASDRFESGS